MIEAVTDACDFKNRGELLRTGPDIDMREPPPEFRLLGSYHASHHSDYLILLTGSTGVASSA